MRQLGTLPDAAQAQTVADYLSTLSIKTQVAPDSDGVAVWVCEEDQVARARQEFQTYLQNPTDERYRRVPRREEPKPAPEPRPRRRRSATGQRRYPLTTLLFLVSLLATLCLYAADSRAWVCRHLFIARITPLDTGLYRYYPDEGLQDLRSGQVWRAVTPAFLHVGGPVHLLFNMLGLFLLSAQIERRYGWFWPALMALALAVVTEFCQYYLGDLALQDGRLVVGEPNPVSGGMSGVLYGMFGFVWMKVVYEPGCGLDLTPTTIFLMVAWLILCMTGAVGSIANMAHLSGLALGMVLGYASAWWNGFGAPLPEA